MTNTPLNPDAPDSQVSEDQIFTVFNTPERDYPQHGSIVLRLHHNKSQSTILQISRQTAEGLRDQLNDHLAAAQPVVNSVEELEALPGGTVIMATGGRWDTEHPELFLKCGYAHAPWMALDPSDRDDGENLESSGAVLKWRCDDEARVLYRPEVKS